MSFGTMSINELIIGTLDWGAVPHSSTISRPAEREMDLPSMTVPRGLREDPARIALPGEGFGPAYDGAETGSTGAEKGYLCFGETPP